MNACLAVVALGIFIFCAGVEATAQITSGKIAGSPPEARLNAQSKPGNLKVLPRKMSADDLNKLMHQYQQYLGVPCGYCHEENPETKQIDYASDENPIKERARFMISMTSDINNKYLSQLRDPRYADPITCGNCHQGQIQPPVFEPKTH